MNSIKLTKLAVLSFIFLFYGFLNSSSAQWVRVGWETGISDVKSLAENGNYVFAGTYIYITSAVYLSTNNGASWIETPLNNRYAE
jgi:hypothetical protein